MVRGVPISLAFHVVALFLVLWLGNAVNRRPAIQPPLRLNVRMVQLPRTQPQETPPVAVEEEPATDPVSEPVRQEPEPDLPPKTLPEMKTDPPVETEKQTEPDKPEEIPVEEITPTEPQAGPAPDTDEPAAEAPPSVTGAAVSGTDASFPFAWYLSLMEGKIARNWNPRQMGFRRDSGIACTVHFTIQRNGQVTGLTLVQSSGIGVYDREALRAVQAAHLTPLPPDYGSSSLGVTMIFNLTAGD